MAMISCMEDFKTNSDAANILLSGVTPGITHLTEHTLQDLSRSEKC
jgi:hypothetical protein